MSSVSYVENRAKEYVMRKNLLIATLAVLMAVPAGAFSEESDTPRVITTIPLGYVHPYEIAINPVTNMLYVTDDLNGKVRVVDSITYEVLNTITTGANPRDVAINSATNTIYVANGGSNTVSVIDGETDTVVESVPVPGATSVAVHEESNTVYVASYVWYGNQSDGEYLYVIDGATLEVRRGPKVGKFSHKVAVDQESNWVYIAKDAYEGEDPLRSLIIVDGSSLEVLATKDAGHLSAVATDLNLNKVYAGSEQSRFKALDAVSYNTLDTLVHSTSDIVIDANKHMAYGVGSSGLLRMNGVTLESSVFANVIAPYDSHFGIAWNETNGYLFVTNYYSGSVTVIHDPIEIDSRPPVAEILEIDRDDKPFHVDVRARGDDTETGSSNITKFYWRWNEAEIRSSIISAPGITVEQEWQISVEGALPNRDNTLWVTFEDEYGNKSDFVSMNWVAPRNPAYVVLGDSYPSGHHGGPPGSGGFSANDPEFGYPRYVRDLISTTTPNGWQYDYLHLARSGSTTSLVLTNQVKIGGVAALRNRVNSWNVVSLTSGADDTDWVAKLKTWYLLQLSRIIIPPIGNIDRCPADPSVGHETISNGIEEILGELKNADPDVRILITGYPNPYPGEPNKPLSQHACFDVGERAVNSINNAIKNGIMAAPLGVTYIDYRADFYRANANGNPHHPLMQFTAFGWPHANSTGHEIIGEAFAS